MYSKFESLCKWISSEGDTMAATDVQRQSRYKGIALIIVNQDFTDPRFSKRRGAEDDFRNLKTCFHQLGYHVLAYFNKTATEMLRLTSEVAKMDHSGYARFIMALSSHGGPYESEKTLTKYDSILGTDHDILLKTLISVFKENKCSSLNGKPKLFFVQCCRHGSGDGSGISESVEVTEKLLNSFEIDNAAMSESQGLTDGNCIGNQIPSFQNEHLWSINIPLQRNMLLACAVPPGFFAFHNTKGSWFISELCKALPEFHKTHDILQILTQVNWRTCLRESNAPNKPEYDKKQMAPCYMSMLKEKVFV